ncbi:MAG TPA: Gfo/Idh/MocA family oxidoreductase [bacterium]
MQGTTRVAVIGLGQWGRHHARIYAGLRDAELVGVADLDAAGARACAHRYRCQAFTDYRALIGRVDAVSVVVPTALHYRVAREFLAAGVHVLVEKPMTSTLQEAAELVAVAEERERVLLVGHVERFKPAVRQLAALAGDPMFIHTRRVRPYDRTRAMDVGVVMDLMIHDIDIILGLTGGRVTEVSGMGLRVHNSHEDLAVAHLRLSTGCVAWLMASRISAEKAAEIEITTSDRAIRLDYLRQHTVVQPFGGEAQRTTVHGEEPLQAELRHFLDCVRGRERPLVSGEDGLRALEVAHQLLRTMAMVSPPIRV